MLLIITIIIIIVPPLYCDCDFALALPGEILLALHRHRVCEFEEPPDVAPPQGLGGDDVLDVPPRAARHNSRIQEVNK